MKKVMRKKMKIKWLLIIVFLILTLFIVTVGCTIPVKSIFWEEDSNGFIQFCTNDSDYYNYYFYTWYEDSYFTILDVVEAKVKKVSGFEWGGYGMVFYLQNEYNFYFLLIDKKGWYTIYEANDGSWIEHIGWTYSDKLNKGFGKINTLKVEHDDPLDLFTISFNGSYVNSFNDDSFKGGYSGFFVEIWGVDEEDFPDTPVDVRFKLKLIENTPPSVIINNPSDGAKYVFGDTITFNGSGNDFEDGDLAGGNLVWTSSIDGQIGTGESFTRSDLSVGTHTITLTATDSDGNEVSASVRILVEYAYPYTVIETIPTQNELNVDQSTNISVIFNIDMNPDTINTDTFIVNGSQTGLLTGTYGYNSGTKTATFNPDNDFKIGEVVNVTLTTEIQDVNGEPIPEPHNWSFTILVNAVSSVFVETSTPEVGVGPNKLAVGDLDGDGDLDLAVVNEYSDTVSILSNIVE